MISPMAWLCSLKRTTLPAMDSICSRMRLIPSTVSSTAFLPVWDTWADFCALSETYFAFWRPPRRDLARRGTQYVHTLLEITRRVAKVLHHLPERLLQDPHLVRAAAGGRAG